MLKLIFFNSIHSQIFSSSFLKKKKFPVWLLHFLLLWSFNLKKKKKLVLQKLKLKVWAGSYLAQSHALLSVCIHIQCEEEEGERESTRRSSLKGQERAIINQMNTGTILKVTLGKCLRDGVEQI